MKADATVIELRQHPLQSSRIETAKAAMIGTELTRIPRRIPAKVVAISTNPAMLLRAAARRRHLRVCVPLVAQLMCHLSSYECNGRSAPNLAFGTSDEHIRIIVSERGACDSDVAASSTFEVLLIRNSSPPRARR